MSEPAVALGNSATTSASALGTGREVNTVADIDRLQAEGTTLTASELKELNAKVKAMEELSRLRERLRALENRRRTSDAIASNPSLEEVPIPGDPTPQPSTRRASTIRPSIERSSSPESSDINDHHRHKRQRYTRGIKITPTYTLRVSSSLREWGDWKRDIERVFEGDPHLYYAGNQKILKALDYLDANLKSLWYTHSDQQDGIRNWSTFVAWTRDNIQNGQNAIATLYEQFNAAKQLSEKSPVQFNAYLSAIERDLPQQDDKASAMAFYSKLTRELKRQFKTSDITIPETRAQCVAVAQRVWEGLYPNDVRRNLQEYKKPDREARSQRSDITNRQRYASEPAKYPRLDSRRDRKDRYRTSHRKEEQPNDNHKERQPKVVCFICQQSGHYSTSCPKRKDQKERHQEAKIQSTQQQRQQSEASEQSSESYSPDYSPRSRTISEEPQILSDSDDSLN
jgi:hypothetical protein